MRSTGPPPRGRMIGSAERGARMTTPEVVERGREAYARRSWAEAYTHLAAAGERGGLAPDDLQRLAFAASLSGHVPAALAALQRASRAWSDAGQIAPAVR